MATAISSQYATVTSCYNNIKSTMTTHGGWTINTDTPPVSNAFVLEYTSAVTIDGELIKIRISTTTGSLLSVGVYDSTNTLRSSSASVIGLITSGGLFFAGDDYIVLAGITTNASAPLLAGNIYTVYNSPLTGADNLGNCKITSLNKARTYNTTGIIVSNAAVYMTVIQATGTSTLFSENNFVNNGAVSRERISLFPALVTLYGNNGIMGTMKNGVFFQTIGTTPTNDAVGKEFTIDGIKYKRLSTAAANNGAGPLVMVWQ